MRKIIYLLILLLSIACTTEKNDAVYEYVGPIAGLQIPKSHLSGTELRITGSGFVETSEILLQLNGADQAEVTERIQADEDGITVRIPSLQMGFYIILLRQDGKEYKIGGINLYTDEMLAEDVELYGIYGQRVLDIRPVSVSKRQIGEPLFSLPSDFMFGAGFMIGEKLYYSYYDLGRIPNPGGIGSTMVGFYQLGCYNTQNTELKAIPWENPESYIAMGILKGKLHVLSTVDFKTYVLQSVSDDGDKEEIATFDFAHLGAELFLEQDGKFQYVESENAILVEGMMGRGEAIRYMACVLDIDAGTVRSVGEGGSLSYCSLIINQTVLYFGVDENSTTVFRIPDIYNWSFLDVSLRETVIKNHVLYSPIYSKDNGVVYMLRNEDVVMYNPELKELVGGKWISSGLSAIMTIK
ncbi:MAG: hypothetical protein ACRDDZ_00865 [Marinifilaceae bacterium]